MWKMHLVPSYRAAAHSWDSHGWFPHWD
jgi:hypothetical protein